MNSLRPARVRIQDIPLQYKDPFSDVLNGTRVAPHLQLDVCIVCVHRIAQPFIALPFCRPKHLHAVHYLSLLTPREARLCFSLIPICIFLVYNVIAEL